MKRNEERVHKHVFLGKLFIDAEGKIWRTEKSTGGRARNIVRLDDVRAENKMPNGYLQVQVYDGGKRICCSAHRLVWYYQNGRIPSGKIVHHIDGDRGNNNPSNLMLMTHSEHNLYHSHVPWNKNSKNQKADNSFDVAEWHSRTVATKTANYLKRATKTFEFRHHDGMTVKELAAFLGVSTRTVYQHLTDYKKGVDAQCP